jgi:Domain of unknown function (DUF4160)
MPEICRFYGIIIAMFYNDHDPPHFHARYGDQQAIIDIGSLRILDGWLTTRALGLVCEWAMLHKKELEENWALARRMEPLQKIQPLE